MQHKKIYFLIVLFVAAVAYAGPIMDNLQITGNTIKSLNTNGDIVLDPNGTGGVQFSDLTASRACYIDANYDIASSTVTDTELGYLSGVTSGIQAQINAIDSFDELSPMTTQGDIIYGGASGTGTRLGIGSANQVLTVNAGGTAPEWANSSGGGGGITIEWHEGTLASPNIGGDGLGSNYKVYEFIDGASQYLYTVIRVPDSYLAGNQITLKGFFYTSATSGTVHLRTDSYLVEPGADQAGSTSDTHASTSSAVTVSGSANQLTAFSAEITDGSGQINAVSVAAGDLIHIRLNRNVGDTAAASAFFPPLAYEVTLQ